MIINGYSILMSTKYFFEKQNVTLVKKFFIKTVLTRFLKVPNTILNKKFKLNTINSSHKCNRTADQVILQTQLKKKGNSCFVTGIKLVMYTYLRNI